MKVWFVCISVSFDRKTPSAVQEEEWFLLVASVAALAIPQRFKHAVRPDLFNPLSADRHAPLS
jgi:hypothetical protein